MPPRMRTKSVGWPAAESLGGGTGVPIGRGGRGRRPREGNDERVNDLNGQGNDQGLGANVGVEGVNGNVKGVNGGEYDGKGGVVVLTRWIEKIENVQEISGCSVDQKVKYTAGSFVGKALTWWNSQIRMLSQEVAISMPWNDFEFTMIEEFCPSHECKSWKLSCGITSWSGLAMLSTLIDMRDGGSNEAKDYTEGCIDFCKDKNGRDDKKRTRTGNAFASTVNPVGRDNTGVQAVQISGALTDEAVRNGSTKKVEKRGNVGEPSEDKNGRDDNKRSPIRGLGLEMLLLQPQTL
nr:reverse transcriptase domain-containing protein [Tanacetum cinerariifolium]